MAGSDVRDVLDEEYAQWVQAQEQIVQDLGHALQTLAGNTSSEDDQALAQAVQRAVQHYHNYDHHLTRAAASQRNYTLLAGPAVSPVESAFMWMGRQRPSMAFQLLYALMGHQIQAELEEILELRNAVDGRPASLASLSASQLTELNNLQTATMREEDRIEWETAKLQESLADQSFLLSGGLTRASASSMSDTGNIGREASSSNITEDSSFLSKKLAILQDLWVQADALRLSTFDRVLELLQTSFQKAQYLLAAAKLQVALRKLGHANVPPFSRRP